MALVTGEVHLIKCISVEVVLRRTTECYHHVPVTREEEDILLTSRTHIILQAGTQITCNPIVPPLYQLQKSWYKFTPTPTEVLPPPMIKLLIRATWKYTSPSQLATTAYTHKKTWKIFETISCSRQDATWSSIQSPEASPGTQRFDGARRS